MKLKTTNRSGAILLGLLVLVIAIIVIGVAAYAIWKALSRWKPRPIDPDDVAIWAQAASAEMQTNLPVTGELSDGTYFIQLKDTNFPQVKVERSTNLVNWEVIAVIEQYQIAGFTDTNPPWPNGFYRVRELSK